MLARSPRSLVAFFVVLLLFFYLRTSSDSPQPASITHSTSEPTVDLKSTQLRPETNNVPPKTRPQSPGELLPGQEDNRQEKESMSDRLFDYLKGHSSHAQNSHSPVPHEEHLYSQTPSAGAAQSAHSDPICASLPDVSDVLVVVRTPAADLYKHLPAHFLTDLRCVDFELFSTVHQNIGPYTVHDALANVSDSRRSKHRDFELYDKLQAAQNAVSDLSVHTEDNDHNLERWTILPHVLATYKMHPRKKWYVFIESDTYLSVSNLMPWLNKMNHTQLIYAGAPVMIGDFELAHGGSGIVLSNAAMEKLHNRSLERLDGWEEATGNRCCGDQILAEALKDSGVRLHRSFPMIQGETPFSLDWSERHWCRPAITWHRMTPQTLDMLWQFETSWARKHADNPDKPPMRFKDYFQMFLIPLIRQGQNRTDWDNLANSLIYTDQSRSQYAHYSFDACRAACDLRQSCVQYVWEPNKCRLGTVVKWGESVTPDKRMTSGWLVQRVEKFGDSVSKGFCPDGDIWILPGDEETEPKPEDAKEPIKDALQIEEEQIQAKAAEEERAKAEAKAREDAEAEEKAKEKAKEEGMPTEESENGGESKSKAMTKDQDPNQETKTEKPDNSDATPTESDEKPWAPNEVKQEEEPEEKSHNPENQLEKASEKPGEQSEEVRQPPSEEKDNKTEKKPKAKTYTPKSSDDHRVYVDKEKSVKGESKLVFDHSVTRKGNKVSVGKKAGNEKE
ncbi:uncharacterized protein PV09_00919 [Verruconis gallopava]|uniref:N-acetylgalactosaminide beta-1,3-galactosyltransferase n=1 Tax=Verruconis gallopava TaxID=253628 RepID=A0A0D2ARC9_9PEZI|nr:uncharacterized protein PV09_00919 [Verruconis gallopava]KIW09025.1 hypothetical protein PV09_00919 [Verruconis gallopava]